MPTFVNSQSPATEGSDSTPYEIAITPDVTVWYSESGVEPNTLVSFDPKTKKFSSTPIRRAEASFGI